MLNRVAFLAVASSVASAAPAQDPGSPQTRDFVQAAGQSDAFEILEAQTALTQSTDPQVRAFAQRMIQDHRRTSQALRQAAVRSGLTPPPTGVGGDLASLLAALQGLRGRDFDKAYFHHQVIGHVSALTTERLYAANGDDPAVRQAAVAATPIIAAHLAMAQRAEARFGGS